VPLRRRVSIIIIAWLLGVVLDRHLLPMRIWHEARWTEAA
jgi:hypothetical protein